MNRPPYLVCVSPRNSCQRSPCAAWSLCHSNIGREDSRRDAPGINTHHSILRNRRREGDPCCDGSAHEICRLSILWGVDFRRRGGVSAIERCLWELHQERQARCPCFDPSRDWADAGRQPCPRLGMRTWRPHDTSPQHHRVVHTIWRSCSRAPLWTIWLVNHFRWSTVNLGFSFSSFLFRIVSFYGYGFQMSLSLWVVLKVHFFLGLTCLQAFFILWPWVFEPGLFSSFFFFLFLSLKASCISSHSPFLLLSRHYLMSPVYNLLLYFDERARPCMYDDKY